jgi:hypothetical protein
VEDPPLAADGIRFTRRLRLEPVGPANARDLWLVHNDDDVWPWYGNEKPGFEWAHQRAEFMGESWHLHGVHKWIAYDRASGEVVGRGGLSRTPVDDDWGQLYAFLPAEPWVRAAHEVVRPFVAHAARWTPSGAAPGVRFIGTPSSRSARHGSRAWYRGPKLGLAGLLGIGGCLAGGEDATTDGGTTPADHDGTDPVPSTQWMAGILNMRFPARRMQSILALTTWTCPACFIGVKWPCLKRMYT